MKSGETRKNSRKISENPPPSPSTPSPSTSPAPPPSPIPPTAPPAPPAPPISQKRRGRPPKSKARAYDDDGIPLPADHHSPEHSQALAELRTALDPRAPLRRRLPLHPPAPSPEYIIPRYIYEAQETARLLALVKRKCFLFGLSQTDLARFLGTSSVVVSRWMLQKSQPSPIFKDLLRRFLSTPVLNAWDAVRFDFQLIVNGPPASSPEFAKLADEVFEESRRLAALEQESTIQPPPPPERMRQGAPAPILRPHKPAIKPTLSRMHPGRAGVRNGEGTTSAETWRSNRSNPLSEVPETPEPPEVGAPDPHWEPEALPLQEDGESGAEE